MKAAVLVAFNQPLEIHDVPDPAPARAGAVIRVRANGICRSDWHAWAEHWPGFLELPHVLGHEMCGVVEAVGPDVGGFRGGERVIVPFSGGDGTCPMCRQGQANICDRPVMPGFQSWGGFAQYVAVDEADFNLVHLPGEVDYVDGAGMGCRYMTAFHGLTARAPVRPGEWVVVYGCGGVGLSAVQIANALGGLVVGVDIHPDKLAFAQQLGAVEVVNGAEVGDPVAAVKAITGGGAQLSVDALGLESTCRNAIFSLRKRGRHVQIGMTAGESGGNLSIPIDTIIAHEIELFGSKGMPPCRYDAMLRLVATGRLAPGRLVTRTVPLAQAGAVLASMESFDTLGFTVIDRF